MPDSEARELSYDMLVSGDRPSILALGVYGAESLKVAKMAVFMVDRLGRVRLMPPTSITVEHPPLLSDDDLDKLPEDAALEALIDQGSNDIDIMKYLKARKERMADSGVEDL